MPDMLQQLSSAFTTIPFNKMLGLQLDQLQGDQVIMSFNMKDELIGNYLHGILHGGVISSVLDMAGGMVVMASAIEQYADTNVEELIKMIGKCSTIDLHINYLRPGIGVRFNAKAWLEKSGKHISFTRMTLHDQDDALIASASGTYLLVK